MTSRTEQNIIEAKKYVVSISKTKRSYVNTSHRLLIIWYRVWLLN